MKRLHTPVKKQEKTRALRSILKFSCTLTFHYFHNSIQKQSWGLPEWPGFQKVSCALAGDSSKIRVEVPPSIAPVSFSLYSLHVWPDWTEKRSERPEKEHAIIESNSYRCKLLNHCCFSKNESILEWFFLKLNCFEFTMLIFHLLYQNRRHFEGYVIRAECEACRQVPLVTK